MTSNPLTPLLLDLSGRTCLVVGGGVVAARRVASLLAGGASVRVVAPTVSPEVEALLVDDAVEWIARGHRSGDAAGCALAVVATDDPAVNQAVGEDASGHGALCNRADRPEAGDVVMPAVLRRGDLVVSVSTGGASPSLAGVVRREIEDHLGPEWEQFTDLLAELRPRLQSADMGSAGRRQAIHDMIARGVLGALAHDDPARARKIAEDVISGGRGE